MFTQIVVTVCLILCVVHLSRAYDVLKEIRDFIANMSAGKF